MADTGNCNLKEICLAISLGFVSGTAYLRRVSISIRMRHGDLGDETLDNVDEDLGFMHISGISRGSTETIRASTLLA